MELQTIHRQTHRRPASALGFITSLQILIKTQMGDAYGGRGMGGRGHRGGFKRRREEEQPVDPIRILLANLMSIGDDAMPVSLFNFYL